MKRYIVFISAIILTLFIAVPASYAGKLVDHEKIRQANVKSVNLLGSRENDREVRNIRSQPSASASEAEAAEPEKMSAKKTSENEIKRERKLTPRPLTWIQKRELRKKYKYVKRYGRAYVDSELASRYDLNDDGIIDREEATKMEEDI